MAELARASRAAPFALWLTLHLKTVLENVKEIMKCVTTQPNNVNIVRFEIK